MDTRRKRGQSAPLTAAPTHGGESGLTLSGRGCNYFSKVINSKALQKHVGEHRELRRAQAQENIMAADRDAAPAAVAPVIPVRQGLQHLLLVNVSSPVIPVGSAVAPAAGIAAAHDVLCGERPAVGSRRRGCALCCSCSCSIPGRPGRHRCACRR
jgi:hypothetical protein